MSDWGIVAFYYDYERIDNRGNSEPVKGVISKAYKNPGIVGMALHAINGLEYFKARCDDDWFDFGYTLNPPIVYDWPELNAAFDVFFDHKCVKLGRDNVSRIADYAKEHEGEYLSGGQIRHELFDCEGTWGWFYIRYTGNAKEGYKTEYVYCFPEEPTDLKSAADKYYSKKRESSRSREEFEENYKGEMDLVYEVADYFKENATLLPSMTDFERSCESLIRKRIKEYGE